MNGISNDNFKLVRDIVYRDSAIFINDDMSYLVESRMSSLLRKTDISSLDELFTKLRNRPAPKLIKSVVEAMTTNETSFFRDDHPFETLSKEILPKLAADNSGTINLWSAACSTGQEPYTVAMAISENCPELLPRVKIYATDIAETVLAKASSGLYSKLEVGRGMPSHLLSKYFKQSENDWQVNQELRDLVAFSELNLAGPWPALPQMDVILLRNVLIYFETDVKTAILKKTAPLLKSNGCLFLGASETTLNLKTDFVRVSEGRSSYYEVKNNELDKCA